MQKQKMENPFLDTRQSWIVAIACAWHFFWLTLINRSAGVLFDTYQLEFNINKQQASWAFSLMDTVSSFTVILCSVLYRYIDTKPISILGVIFVAGGYFFTFFVYRVYVATIVFGAIVGLGQGMMYFSNAIIINQYFLKKRVFGNGIYFAGGTLGSFFVPQALTKSLTTFGLRYTLLMMGSAALFAGVATIFMKSPLTIMREKQSAKEKALQMVQSSVLEEIRAMPPPPPPYEETIQKSPQPPPQQDATYLVQGDDDWSERLFAIASRFTFLYRPIYTMIVLSGIGFSFSFVIYPVTAVEFVMEKGYSKNTASLILTTFSLGDISGRLLIGLISEWRFIKRDTLMSYIYVVWAIGWFLFALSDTLNYLVPTSVLLGFGIGCGTPLYTVLLAEYLGISNMPITFGFYRMLLGLTSLFRPYYIGYFKDIRKSSKEMYLFLACYTLFVAVLWAMVSVIERMRTKTFNLKSSLPDSKYSEGKVATQLDIVSASFDHSQPNKALGRNV